MAPAVLESTHDRSASTLTGTTYRNFVNPEWARLLSLLGKVAPPLVITEDQIAQYLDAIEAAMDTVHSSASFWSDAALHLAQRAVRV